MGLFSNTLAGIGNLGRPGITSRSLGNAQSRNPNLPNAPAWGQTSNVTGAQTASQSALSPYPGLPSMVDLRPGAQPLPSAATAAAPYAGGNVAQLAQNTRNAGIKQYYSALSQPDTPADTALAGRIDALTAASQAANPPRQQAPVPIEQFSTAANTLREQEAARQQNQYGSPADPNRLLPQQKYDIARQSALAQQAGGPAADPTGIGRRFGANTPLGMEADQITRDQAAKDRGEGVFIQKGGYGSPQEFLGFNNTRDGAFAAAQQSALNRPQERAAWKAQADARREQQKRENPELFAKQEARRAEQTAFLGENDGKNRTALNREQRRLKRSENKAESNSALAKPPKIQPVAPGLNDDLRNPVAQNQVPVRQTPDQAKVAVQSLAQNNEHIKKRGLTPESTPRDVVQMFATEDITKMNSTDKFQTARALHDFMLSQVEGENWNMNEGAGQPDASGQMDSSYILQGLHNQNSADQSPANQKKMIQWYEDMVKMSQSMYKETEAERYNRMIQPGIAPHIGQGSLAGDAAGDFFNNMSGAFPILRQAGSALFSR